MELPFKKKKRGRWEDDCVKCRPSRSFCLPVESMRAKLLIGSYAGGMTHHRFLKSHHCHPVFLSTWQWQPVLTEGLTSNGNYTQYTCWKSLLSSLVLCSSFLLLPRGANVLWPHSKIGAFFGWISDKADSDPAKLFFPPTFLQTQGVVIGYLKHTQRFTSISILGQPQ